MKRVLVVVAAAVVVVAGYVAPAVARGAAPRIVTASSPAAVSIAPRVGPPTTRISVSGSGFGRREKVEIYFDTTDLALTRTSSKGSFSGMKISVPASATPGNHSVKALSRRTGRAAQTTFRVRTDWPEFGFNARHSSYNPFENILGPSNVAGLGLAMVLHTSPGALDYISSSPAVAGVGVVYTDTVYGKVYALDASAGHKLWSYTTTKDGYGWIHSSPAVARGVVYVSSIGRIFALDASTGHKLWSYRTGSRLGFTNVDSSPTVVGGVVYVGSGNQVYALRASSGHKLWSYATGGGVASSPAVVRGTVYVSSDDGNEYALRASTGHKLWSYFMGSGDPSSSAVVRGVVYVSGDDGGVYALRASTGHRLWVRYIGGSGASSPAVADGTVYVGTPRNVYALDASTGHKLWSYPNTTGGAPGFSLPAAANGVVYDGSGDGNVYALDASTGQKLWSTGGGYSPVVVNGEVYLSSGKNEYVFALPTNANPAVP